MRGGSSSRNEFQEEMENLAKKAYEHYKHHQLEEALFLYRKAYDTAIIIEDYENSIKYKQWEGHCLYQLDRFREALSIFIPLSETSSAAPHEYFSSVIDQIDMAIRLPIDIRKIRNLIDEASNILRHHGLQASKSMLLIVESSLAHMRYDFASALDNAREASRVYDQRAKSRHDRLLYYRYVLDNLASLNLANEMKEVLTELQDVNTSRVFSKEMIILASQAKLALIEGRSEEAYKIAKQRLEYERTMGSNCFVSLRLVVHAGIEAKKLDDVRNHLAKMILFRHLQYGNWRYQIQLYCGHYYTALYQQNHDMRFLKLATKHYQRADNIGSSLDMLLDCNGRQKEVQRSLDILRSTVRTL